MQDDEPMVNDYLDCQGNKRTFRLEAYAHGLFIHAVEVREGGYPGLRFVLPVKPGEVPPWGELRERIRSRLCQRDIVPEDRGELEILNQLVRAQISDTGRSGERRDTPILYVDDMELTWEDLGRALMTYSGWGLRLEIRNCGEE